MRATASTASSVSVDKPEHFFLERYRVAYAAEMTHFFEAIEANKPVNTSINDGVKALELADAATRSWREKRVIEVTPDGKAKVAFEQSNVQAHFPAKAPREGLPDLPSRLSKKLSSSS